MTRKPTTSKKTTASRTTKKKASPPSETPVAVTAEEVHDASPTSAPVTEDVAAEIPLGEDATADAPFLKKPDFIDRVVELSGGKKKDVKPAVEAALAVLGDAIAAGEDINLPPLGKLKMVRKKEAPNANVFTCRLRRSHNLTDSQSADQSAGEKTGQDPLASADAEV